METTRETRRSTRTNKGQLPPPDSSPSQQHRHHSTAGKGPVASKQATPGKPASKGRRPGRPRKQTPEQTTPVEKVAVDEGKPEPLPHKIVDGEPLPTLKEPQCLGRSTAEYQSIAQSAVLATSLKRSRDAWVSGSHFSKYYTKTIPKKVKDRTAEDKEQMARDKQLLKNMVRIGECSLTIDPHIFRVCLYMTRELHAGHINRQHQQWTAPHAAYTHPQSYHKSSTPSQQHSAFYNGQGRPQTPYSAPHTPSLSPAPKYQPTPVPVARGPTVTTTGSTNGPATIPRPTGRTPGTTSSQAAPDPVIHMLAQRAGTDPKLKAVMKIVAAGKATPQQLEYFQGHINELTSILEARQKQAAASQPAASHVPTRPLNPPSQQQQQQQQQHPSAPGPPHPEMTSRPQAPAPAPSPASSVTAVGITTGVPVENQARAPAPATSTQMLEQPAEIASPRPASSTPVTDHGASQVMAQQHTAAPPRHAPASAPAAAQPYQPGPPVVNSPYPVPPLAKPSFRPIYFEFIEGPGDRLAFPENSILEFLPGGRQVRFSFLVTKAPSEGTRSGSAAAGGGSDKEGAGAKGYYQGVTGALYAENAHSLECLWRAVRAPEEVHKYMEGVFDSMERADERFLAMRLPKEAEGSRTEPNGVDGELDAATAAKRRKTGGQVL